MGDWLITKSKDSLHNRKATRLCNCCPMSGLTTFAIFGLGKLGSCILTSLLEHPRGKSFRIHILTRPGSSRTRMTFPGNVALHPIDYSDLQAAEDQLVIALEKIQVVISTVGAGVADPNGLARTLMSEGKHSGYIPGYANQRIVAKAAKRAGCKLFIPAEYGSPTHPLAPEGPIFTRGKRIFHLEMMEIGLPFLLFYTGKFIDPDSVRTPLPENTLELGETPYPTSRHHAAQFMIQVLTIVPLPRLAWGVYMIRGCRRQVLNNGKWEQFEITDYGDRLSKWLAEMSLTV